MILKYYFDAYICLPKFLQSMFEAIKKLLGLEKTDYAQMVKAGAIILDVRSKVEYEQGNIKGSLNIAVDQLSKNLHLLKDRNKVIITCCASGMRSAAAKNLLKSNGYKEVYNGGGWSSLQAKIAS
jgi:rhodanese-related sulfurtransferase